MDWIKIDTKVIDQLPATEVLAFNSQTKDVAYGFLHANVSDEVVCDKNGFSLLFPVTHYKLLELPN